MNPNPPATDEARGAKIHHLRVWLIALIVVVAYFGVGKGRIPFVAAWASTLPGWLKLGSALLFCGLMVRVFVGIYRGVFLGRTILHGSWLIAAVFSGFLFAACMADNPAIFVALSLGLYLLDLLCRCCVGAFSRKAGRA